MPKIKRKLTPRRLKLAKTFAQTGNLALAAREAGMHAASGRVALYDPAVQAVVKREQLHILATVGVPVAVKTLIDVASDTKERGSTRVMAADKILSHAPELITADALEGADLEQLKQIRDELQASAARHAKIIDAEVIEVEEPGALD